MTAADTGTATAGPARADGPVAVAADSDDADLSALRTHALNAREHIVNMCAGPEGGHLGGSMSLVDILVTLYFAVLRGDQTAPLSVDRDVLLLSKGHAGLGLYAVLAERGILDLAELADYGKPGSLLMGHPVRAVPGVEMPSGSLGHGLPLANGFALAARHDGLSRRVFVLLGDGELQEGSVWEAAMASSSLGLDNLTAVVDRNKLQITGGTEDTVALEPLADRWRSFGWAVREVNGHDLTELLPALSGSPAEPGRPTVIIAHTMKGRGLPFVENRRQSHYAKLNAKNHQRAMAVLDSQRGEVGP